MVLPCNFVNHIDDLLFIHLFRMAMFTLLPNYHVNK